MKTQTPGASAPVTTSSPIETCRAVFGECPEDILSIVQTANDALEWFSYLFYEIEKLSRFEWSDESASLMESLSTIKMLSGMGNYISSDIGEYVGCEAGKMAECLKAAEARKGGAA
jgi:hypothetical protein